MKKKYIGYLGLAVLLGMSSQEMRAQQGFGTDKPAKSAVVHLESDKRGLLVPRVALTDVNVAAPVSTPANSLLVYNTANNEKVKPGYYYWESATVKAADLNESNEGRWVRFAKQEDITNLNLTLGGDVTGGIGANTVVQIQGQPVGAGSVANQVLVFDLATNSWVPTLLTGDKITGAALTSDGKINVGTGAAGALLITTQLGINPKSIEAGDIKGPSTGTGETTTPTPGQVMVSNAAGTTEWKPFENIYTADGKITGVGDNKTRTVSLENNELHFVGAHGSVRIFGVDEKKAEAPKTGVPAEHRLDVRTNASKKAIIRASSGESGFYFSQEGDNLSNITAFGKTSPGMNIGVGTDTNTTTRGIGFSIKGNTHASLTNGGSFEVGQNSDKIAGGMTTANYPALAVKSGHVKVEKINELTGTSTDKIVVAGTDGVLKTIPVAAVQLPRMFYLPSVMVPTGAGQLPTDNEQAGVKFGEINLYTVYEDNFRTPEVSSIGAAKTLPTWNSDQLEYHVGWYDKNVFTEVKIDANGLMKYKIVQGADVTMGSFFNIILKVKDTALSPGVNTPAKP